MSTVVELLKKEASLLRQEEEWNQTKSAAVTALVQGGMSKEAAEQILSQLAYEAKEETK